MSAASRVSDISMIGWAETASVSSGCDVSPSEDDSHMIQLEMMVLLHLKSLIGSWAITGTGDNCTISAYINRPCTVFTVLCCRGPEIQDLRETRLPVDSFYLRMAESRALWFVRGGTQEQRQSTNSLSQIWTPLEMLEVNLFALRQITHSTLCTKANAAAQCLPTPMFYLSPYQAWEADVASGSCGHGIQRWLSW